MTGDDRRRLEEALGYRFRDPSLLDLALTHRSHGHESGRRHHHNESLEFLGDAILGFVTAERLRALAPPDAAVGALSRRRAALVSEPSLAAHARALGIGDHLRLGRGEALGGGRDKDSILADAFEAVLAAIYLDGGIEPVRAVILSRLGEALAAALRQEDDPKTELQEKLQARGIPPPEYRAVATSGPDHARRFVVELLVDGRAVARGEGRSKKAAGVEAAREALRRLGEILRSPEPGEPPPPAGEPD